ncbi:hypothetical protein [Salidesulfovibrio brasiliensis]|uniref:hypothetical protein n=1 Tax=Salidesulfovibrio brasiliensis TaxID=221711 RepID=UPI0006CFFD34|nr:hypothetical protein [Salidesulfovibrio brasiliensis]
MKSMVRILFSTLIITVLATGFALAGNSKSETVVAAAEPGKTQGQALKPRVDKEVAKMHAHFKRFAQSRIASLNRNHLHSRSRMKVEQQPDGSWRARYHEFAANTERCRVRKKDSKIIPFTGTMILEERVYESVGESRTDCRSGEFRLVERKPNYVIFRFQNGAWK